MVEKRFDVASRPGAQVVHAGDRVAAIEQGGAEVRADEPGAAGDECVQTFSPSFDDPSHHGTEIGKRHGYPCLLRCPAGWVTMPWAGHGPAGPPGGIASWLLPGSARGRKRSSRTRSTC